MDFFVFIYESAYLPNFLVFLYLLEHSTSCETIFQICKNLGVYFFKIRKLRLSTRIGKFIINADQF